MAGQACTGPSGFRNSRFHNQTFDSRIPWRHLPLDLWYNILEFAEPAAIAQFAAVSKDCKTVAYHNELWKPHFRKTWSPEYSGTLQTMPDGKDFRSLYGCWQTGQPAAVGLIEGVHISDNDFPARMEAVQLSQAGALAAWSVGSDGALVGTDMTTCNILKRFQAQRGSELYGLTVLDSESLVVAGGTRITGWDPRQPGNGPSATPAFRVKYRGVHGVADHSVVHTIIPAASPEGGGPPQLLTGETEEKLFLWDLRLMGRGPLRDYTTINPGVNSLLRDPRHGILLAGGLGGITCLDFNTGAQLSALRGPADALICSQNLAVGRDRLISVDTHRHVTEWALPDPHAIVAEPEPHWVRTLPAHDNNFPDSIQGLGEDLQRILVGTQGGSISMWECLQDPDKPPICWSLGDHLPVPVTCLTGTDELVVIGLLGGALRFMRLGS